MKWKMLENLKRHRKSLKKLMIILFILTFLGGQDAITSTIQYNRLDLQNTIGFKIEEKYNKKKEGISFPDLNFKGKIVTTEEKKEIKVSKRDFDSHEIGETITVFKTKSGEFMTQYEIDNQGIIHIGNKGFSFVFIPTFIFFIVGLFCLFVIVKK